MAWQFEPKHFPSQAIIALVEESRRYPEVNWKKWRKLCSDFETRERNRTARGKGGGRRVKDEGLAVPVNRTCVVRAVTPTSLRFSICPSRNAAICLYFPLSRASDLSLSGMARELGFLRKPHSLPRGFNLTKQSALSLSLSPLDAFGVRKWKGRKGRNV